MHSPLIWFNKHLSNTWEVLALLRRTRRPGEFRVFCTHPRPRYPGRRHADLFEQEPGGLGDEEYVSYCLDAAQRHQVTLFLPGRKALTIVRARRRFAAIGVRVLAAADARALALIASKMRVYEALAGAGFRLPDFAVVNDLAGFDAAWAQLRARHGRLCYKPAVSVYGLGFQNVDDGTAESHWPPDDPNLIRLTDARRSLAAKGRFADVMLMQYLPGPERSVDCLAQDGRLLRCVVRRKEAGGQVLEANPELATKAARLTEGFGLTGMFNVQFRDEGGESYLLEINPRMSGGLPLACRSGLILPLWAIRLALGTATPEDLPYPRTGLWVPQPELMPSV